MNFRTIALLSLFVFALSPLVWAQQESPAGGNWVQFDGQTDYAAASDSATLKMDKQPGLSIEAWIFPEAWPQAPAERDEFTFAVVAEKPGSYGLGLIAERTSSGAVKTGFAFYLNDRILTWTSPLFALQQWYHLAGAFDNSRDTIGFFVDGDDFISTNPFKENPRNMPFEFSVGKPTADIDEYFKGQLDELRISNVARYDRKFVPQKQAFEVDQNTLAL
jgi:hypothetical protein